MGSSHHGYAVFFLNDLWYNNINKSTRPLEEAQQGGYLIQSPARLLAVRTMRETILYGNTYV